MMKSLARSASCPSVTCSHPVGVTLGKSLGSSESGLFCLSGENWFEILWCRREPLTAPLPGEQSFSKKLAPQFDLPSNHRYSLIRKRDWRSGSALRSHRRGHWFEPSITHQRTPVSRNGGFIVSTPAHPPQRPRKPADPPWDAPTGQPRERQTPTRPHHERGTP